MLLPLTDDGAGRPLDATTVSGRASPFVGGGVYEDRECVSVNGQDCRMPEESQSVVNSSRCGGHLVEEVGSIVGNFLLLSFKDRCCS